MTGLSKGTFYQFIVLALNSIGYSAPSLSVTVVAANVPNTPSAPVNIPSQTSQTQIAVQWTAPTQNVGSTITSYIVWWKTQA